MTLFDVLTVVCFTGLVIAFFQWTARGNRTLLHLLISSVLFAIANQIGNAGLPLFGLILVVAGAGYAALIIGEGARGGPPSIR
jgi:hypothetical protein